MVNVGLLLLRLAFGGLLAGHGAQKLFGWFGGYGLQGTSGWLESMGLRPGRPWAILAGLSEFGGGLLTLLGFLNPLGPVGFIGSMLMATRKVHWGNPIWVTSGGAELPVLNMAAATAVAISGPGKFSLDRLLGIRLPAWVFPAGVLAAFAGVEYAMRASEGQEEVPVEEAGGELIAHEQTEHEA